MTSTSPWLAQPASTRRESTVNPFLEMRMIMPPYKVISGYDL
jgi:hypothetical protein